MNQWRLHNHLNDALRVDGDVCVLNLENAKIFSNLNKIAKASYRDVVTDVGEPNELCFTFINTNHITINILNDVWNKMAYGGTIFFSSYGGSTIPSDRLIKEFLEVHDSRITVARQMLLNGKREHNLIIKCFPPKKKPNHDRNNEALTVATVLKSGGEYSASYVNHIANSIKENLTLPYEFVCLTDLSSGFNNNVHKILPFDNDFPKWWGKIELFKAGKFNTNKVLYVDLDTFIISNIDDIARYGGEFFGLRDFYHQYGLGSGFMCWKNENPRIFQIYEKFMEAPVAHMNNHKYGDQEFIGNILGKNIDYVQDLYPKQILSYKKDCVSPSGQVLIPDSAKVVCFHGPPRPHQVKDPSVTRYWRG